MTKKKPATPNVDQRAYNISEEQRGEQRGNIAQANETVMQGKQILNETNPLLNQYTTPDASGQTPYRRLLSNKLASTTADTAENLESNMRNKAAASGFANSPLQFAAQSALGNERAKRISDIPLQVEEAAFPREMQALGLQNDIQLGRGGLYNQFANTYNNVGRTYNPQAYFGLGVDAEEAARQRKSNLWGNLLKTGATVAPMLL